MPICFSQTLLVLVFKNLLSLGFKCVRPQLFPVKPNHDSRIEHYFYLLSKFSTVSQYFRSSVLETISSVIDCDAPVLDLVSNCSAISTLFRYIFPKSIAVKSNTFILLPLPTHLITSITFDFNTSYSAATQIDWQHLLNYCTSNKLLNIREVCFVNCILDDVASLSYIFPNLSSLKFHQCSFHSFSSTTILSFPESLSHLNKLSLSEIQVGMRFGSIKNNFTIDVSNLVALACLSISCVDSLVGLNLLQSIKELTLDRVKKCDGLHSQARLAYFYLFDYDYVDPVSFDFNCLNFEKCFIVLRLNKFPNIPLYKFLVENSKELALLDFETSDLLNNNGVFCTRNCLNVNKLAVVVTDSDCTVDISESLQLSHLQLFGITEVCPSPVACLSIKSIALHRTCPDLIYSLLSQCCYVQSLALKFITGEFTKPFPNLLYLQFLTVNFRSNFNQFIDVLPRLRMLQVSEVPDFDLILVNTKFSSLINLNLCRIKLGKGLEVPNLTIKHIALDNCALNDSNCLLKFQRLVSLVLIDVSIPICTNSFLAVPFSLTSVHCHVPVSVLSRVDFSMVNISVLSGVVTYLDGFSTEKDAREKVMSLGKGFDWLIDGLKFIPRHTSTVFHSFNREQTD
ncbi:hypothetical protein RCL1_003059 [Eukaryota sp. TZLM3-RCL]